MKRISCLFLCLMMLLGSVSAMAEAPKISNIEVVPNYWNPDFNHNKWQTTLKFDLNTDANVTAVIYDADTGKAFNTLKVSSTGNYAVDALVQAGAVKLSWPAVDYQGWHPAAGVTGHFLVKLLAKNADGSTSDEYTFNYGFAHTIDKHSVQYIPDPDAPVDPLEPVVPKAGYTHNNIRSFGPAFKDVKEDLTKKWYRFTALDLSQDGEQVYKLISGDHYIVGEVKVAVNGDSVKVTYRYDDVNTWDWKKFKFFTFFGDIADVTTVDPAEIENKFEYGVEYSIANDLGGDTSVLLYMCNKATHTDDETQLKIFRPEYDPFEKQINAQIEMLGLTAE